MTTLLTGATGSLGHALVERLAPTTPLLVLVRRGEFESARERLACVLGPAGRAALAAGTLVPVEADLSERYLGLSRTRWDALARRTTRVVHVAARTDFRGDGVADYRPVNLDGALRLHVLAAAAECAFVHVSTAYVSGVRDGLIREDELDVGQAHRNGYERSKLEAEQALVDAARRTGTPLAVFRPGIVLPDAPRDDVPEGPGPLAYLRLLANLEGRPGRRDRVIRYCGDPAGLLNLVPLSFVIDVLAAAVQREWQGVATYHLTARPSFRVEQVSRVMNDCLVGLRTVVEPSLDLAGLDRYEALLERSFSVYRDYMQLRHEYDRTELEQAFPEECAGAEPADEAWLARVYREHLRVWRGTRAAGRGPDPVAASHVRGYFDAFLPPRTGRRLVPGIESLSADFTVTVQGVGSFAMSVVRGVLTRVGPAVVPCAEMDFEVSADTLLEAVSAHARPSQLFFQRRVKIRGDVHRALRTATALEDFFRLFPYQSAVPTEFVA